MQIINVNGLHVISNISSWNETGTDFALCANTSRHGQFSHVKKLVVLSIWEQEIFPSFQLTIGGCIFSPPRA